MGRTPVRKAAPQSRSLSSRLSSALPSGASTPSRPSPLQFDFAPPTADTDSQSSMPAQKRTFDDPVGPATPASATAKDGSGKKPRRVRRGGVAHKRARAAEASKQNGDDDVEDGQVVEGDFSDLFMVDTTPAAVREQDRFVPTPSAAADSPLKKGGSAKDGEQEEDMLTAPVAQSEGKALPADELAEDEDGDRTMDSDDAMRAFAREVAETDDEDLSDESDESDEDEDDAPTPVVPAPLYDNEEDLQKAIEGRIVDDSSAPVRSFLPLEHSSPCIMLTHRCRSPGGTTRRPTSPRPAFSAAVRPFPPSLPPSLLILIETKLMPRTSCRARPQLARLHALAVLRLRQDRRRPRGARLPRRARLHGVRLSRTLCEGASLSLSLSLFLRSRGGRTLTSSPSRTAPSTRAAAGAASAPLGALSARATAT